MKMRKIMLGLVLAPLALGFSTGAIAQSQELPSSVDVMTRDWRVMNPSTFQLSHASVLEQFDRVAVIEATLTSEKKERLAEMLANNEGVEVWVPDGIGLDYLTGRRRGAPHVYPDMNKAIGRTDRALLFDLGDGVYIYWFTGTRESCNNIGVVVIPPEPITPVAPYTAFVQEYRWVMMPQEDLQIFRMQGYIPSVYIRACCNNAGGVCSSLFISGMVLGGDGVDSDPTMVRVRVPVQ